MDNLIDSATKFLGINPFLALVIVGGIIWAYAHSKVDEEREDKYTQLFTNNSVILERLTTLTSSHEKRLDRIEDKETE